jgi:hypothetical protein
MPPPPSSALFLAPSLTLTGAGGAADAAPDGALTLQGDEIQLNGDTITYDPAEEP